METSVRLFVSTSIHSGQESPSLKEATKCRVHKFLGCTAVCHIRRRPHLAALSFSNPEVYHASLILRTAYDRLGDSSGIHDIS